MTSKYWLSALVALGVFTAYVHANSIRIKAERTEYHAPNGNVITNAVSLTWAPTQGGLAPLGYEVQRRLFPFGWRKTGMSRDGLWIDRKPSKRESWYRVRPIYEDASGEWSPKAFAPAVK